MEILKFVSKEISRGSTNVEINKALVIEFGEGNAMDDWYLNHRRDVHRKAGFHSKYDRRES